MNKPMKGGESPQVHDSLVDLDEDFSFPCELQYTVGKQALSS